MYRKELVSLVLPAFNEEKNIVRAIKDYKSLGIFDEIVVVDNNCKDRTASLALENGAVVVREKKQGYGFALQKGMKAAKGKAVVLCEPDGTFTATDSRRLLALTRKYDMVLGTRTNKKFIKCGANMGTFLRWGNVLVAKMTQVLFGTGNLTDCGCTFRALNRKTIDYLLPRLEVGGSHFLPEMITVAVKGKFSFLEIPVRYGPRVGQSKITGSKWKSVKVGIQMVRLILAKKFFEDSKQYIG